MGSAPGQIEAEPIGSKWAIRLAIFLARRLPKRAGRALASWIGQLAGRLSPRRRAILEANLAHVLPAIDPRQRRRVAVEIFGHAARSYFDLLYLPRVTPEEIVAMATSEEPGWTQLREAYDQGNGVVLVTTHQSSFDLAGQTLAARGLLIGALTLPTPERAFFSLNQIRRAQGIGVLPVGPKAVREAMRILRRGGILVVGGDRPVKGQGTVVQFFGQPTLLPDGHVRLAMHTKAAVFCAFARLEEGRYYIRYRPVEVVRSGAKEQDLLANAQRIALVLEGFIRAHPEQWHLFLRLWDD